MTRTVRHNVEIRRKIRNACWYMMLPPSKDSSQVKSLTPYEAGKQKQKQSSVQTEHEVLTQILNPTMKPCPRQVEEHHSLILKGNSPQPHSNCLGPYTIYSGNHATIAHDQQNVKTLSRGKFPKTTRAPAAWEGEAKVLLSHRWRFDLQSLAAREGTRP